MRLARILVFTACAVRASAAEADALAIDANIAARHFPVAGILDPIFASPTSDQIVGYTRCGDSAIWTGHYLAAEAYRYKVTGSAEALNNVKKAVAGIKAMADVTAINLLARCMVLADSPYAAGIQREEAANGIHSASPWIWVGNTSRDQYLGVMFGLGAAYDLVDDAGIKTSIADLITRLVGFLTGHNWSVVLPDGSTTTSFLIRPEEMLSLLQTARHVNPDRFSTYYDELRITLGFSGTILAPVGIDVASDSSYFKFNLDYIAFYNLVRLESSSAKDIYEKGYLLVRNHTSSHQNAFFNMIDRALEGPNAARDAETITLLDQWLQRPKRDISVNLNGVVPVCGDRACQPVPVPLRPPTDFLWQRDPFQLTSVGSNIIESSGIDYILPYWMARYYGINAPFTVQSAAANVPLIAPDSLASIFGSNVAGQTDSAKSLPLPTSLGGISLKVKDAAGMERLAPLLYVASGQINFQTPAGTAPGTATFTILNGANTLAATGQVQNVAPTLFTKNGNGTGVAAATAIRVNAGNPQLRSDVPVFQCDSAGCVSVPIDTGVDTPVIVTLYGTGIRHRGSLANVQVTIGGTPVTPAYAGVQPTFAGLDQVNMPLTLNLRGKGEVDVVVTVDGAASNPVRLNIK